MNNPPVDQPDEPQPHQETEDDDPEYFFPWSSRFIVRKRPRRDTHPDE